VQAEALAQHDSDSYIRYSVLTPNTLLATPSSGGVNLCAALSIDSDSEPAKETDRRGNHLDLLPTLDSDERLEEN
jgi:hypothetical protein